MTTISTYFTLPPNWAEGVKYARAWRTSINTVATGVEQRSAIWTWPRRSLEFSVAGMTSAESNYIKRKFYKGQGTVYGLPLWTSRGELYEEAAAAQAVVLTLNLSGHEFAEGAELILLSGDPDTYEVGQIATITLDIIDLHSVLRITLTENLAATWPAGTTICPVLPCRIRAEQEIEARTAEVITTTIEAAEAFEV